MPQISASIRALNSALEISHLLQSLQASTENFPPGPGCCCSSQIKSDSLGCSKPRETGKLQRTAMLSASGIWDDWSERLNITAPMIPMGAAVLLPKGALLQSNHYLPHQGLSIFTFSPPSSISVSTPPPPLPKIYIILKKNWILKLARWTKPIWTQKHVTAAQKITVSLTSVQSSLIAIPIPAVPEWSPQTECFPNCNSFITTTAVHH